MGWGGCCRHSGRRSRDQSQSPPPLPPAQASVPIPSVLRGRRPRSHRGRAAPALLQAQGTPVTPPLISALFSPQVSQESISNKMNSSNLACVFGLNLIWPSQGASSLSALVPLNLFTELLIEYYEKVFSGREIGRAHV